MVYALPSLIDRCQRLEIPFSCSVELLAACNLRCVHCYVDTRREAILDLPVVVRLLDALADLGTFAVTFTGGEIGLHPELFAILDAARARRFAVTLLTSGTRWGPPEWDALAHLGISAVRLSLYGVSPAVHDRVTGVDGSHTRTMSTLEGLLARGVPVGLATPIMAHNADAAVGVLALARDRGLSIAIDPNLVSRQPGTSVGEDLLAPAAALSAVYREPELRIAAAARCTDDLGPGDRPCGAGALTAFVACTGEVRPCPVWPEVAGELATQSFAAIWRGSPVMRRARDLRFRDLHACLDCPIRPHCGFCPAMNLTETGAVGTPAPTFCRSGALWAGAART